MSTNFDDIPLIPHTTIMRAVGVSDTYGNRCLEKCIIAGLVKHPHKTVTGRTHLTPPDGRAFHQALISTR